MNKKTSDFIDNYPDWRGTKLRLLAEIITEAMPDATDDIKWGVPIWSGKKTIVGISGFKSHIKVNFLYGAALPDPDNIFNSGLDSKQHRSIDFRENDKINEAQIKNILKAAWDYDQTQN